MKHIFLTALMLIACSGCVSGQYATKSLEEALHYDAQALRQYQVNENWWRIYNDPQLDYLVEIALNNNVDFAKAAIQVNKALYQANLLGADLVPEFSAGLDASVSRSIKSGNSTVQNFSGDLRISYEVDLWQRLRDAVSAQQWEYEATLQDLHAARLTLINSVVDAYYNLYYLDNSLKISREAIANYRRLLELTSLKYQEGKVASVEPAQAAQSLLSYENNLLSLESSYKQAMETLRNLLNLQPDDEIKLVYQDLLEISMPEVDLNVPLYALANRPDLKAAEARLSSAFKSLQATEKSWFPSITIGASLSSASDKARAMFDLPFTGGNISINLPFLQWNSIRWQVKLSEAEFESVRLDFEQSLTSALNEVDYLYYAYGNSVNSLQNVQQKYVYDLKISDYYQIRYENGAGEFSDWLNALNTAINSRLNTLESRYRVIQQENLLYQAMAGRYEPRD